MKSWWMTLAPRARTGLVAACAALLLLSGLAGWWLLRGEPAVLFSELREQDAATLAGELDKLKVPYTVADEGRTLLVDRSQVHAARMKLMGRELPLHGSVGFEVFNTADFGMTEFAQKINYQRALQGELTRTILAFPEVRDARVHLALPEQALFRQNTTRPKAAITLTLQAGQSLRGEQVAGIQRLVAAAVPGLQPQEVTIVDQRGVALTRIAEGDADAASGAGAARLELKREMEAYLARKAAAVLEQAFGVGQALASVDLVLDMDQVRVTTEDVIAAPDARGGPATGVLVREKESARDSPTPELRAPDARAGSGSSMQRDVEYQAGRRVEHVVGQPGAVRRIQVVAVVRQPLGAQEREQVQKLLAAAVGASAERGDTVVLQALQPAPAAETPLAAPATPAPLPARPATQHADSLEIPPWAMPLALAWLAICLLALAWERGRKRRRAAADLPRLTEAQREAALQQVRGWMLQSSAAGTTAASTTARGRAA